MVTIRPEIVPLFNGLLCDACAAIHNANANAKAKAKAEAEVAPPASTDG